MATTDDAIAAGAIRSGAVIADRVAAWITARHLLTEMTRPLPTDVLALALWLTGVDPDDEEGDTPVEASPTAPGSSLAGENPESKGDFGFVVEARR